MFRFLLRRIPRFGFLTLFATMLLFVSAAGWFKFHYDLYLEEERLLADLAKAGCEVGIGRYGDVARSIPPQEPAWYRLPEPCRRIKSLDINYPRIEIRPLIERAATLPSVENLDARYIPETRPVGPAIPFGGAASYFDGLNVELPQFSDTPIPDLDQPLPAGEPLSQDESVAAIDAWRIAWLTPTRLPRTGIVRSDSTSARHPDNREGIGMRGPDGYLEAIGKDMSLGNRTKFSGLRREVGGLREINRMFDRMTVEHYVDDPDMRWLESSTGRKKLETGSLSTGGPIRFYALEKDLVPSSIDSVQRTDGGLLRIDFRPKTKSYPEEGIEDETRLSAVLRPDRGFAIEAYDIRVERADAASPEPIVWTARFRGVSSDHGGAYLLDAYSIENLSTNGFRSTSAPSYSLRSWSSRLAYDFEQEPPAELFEPATYGAVEFPPPRPLPVWRWYRVTFVLSLALLAFILAKKGAARFRKPTAPLPSSEAAEVESTPADAEAVASR